MRRNVASQNVAAQMNSRTDGSPLTTSVSVLVTKDGGTQTAGGGTLTHEGNGHWNYAPTQGETDAAHVAFTFTHASGVNQTVQTYPVSFDPTDAVRLGLSALPNAAAEAAGGLYTRGAGAGQINQNANGQVDTRTVAMAADVVTAAAIANGAIDAATFAAGAIDAAAMAADAIGSSEFAQAAADKVWATAARALTDKAGFALTTAERTAIIDELVVRKFTAAAGAASTITLDGGASALDDFYNESWVLIVAGTGAGQARRITDYVGATKVATVHRNWVTNPAADSVCRLFGDAAQLVMAGGILNTSFGVDAIDALAVKADVGTELADALLDRASAIEGYTPRQLLRLFAAVLVGKADGLEGTTAHYRDVADTKNRITATVTADGNRTAVTLDAT